MLEHLLTLEPEPLTQAASSFVELDKLGAGEILNGKVNTQEWLKKMGADDPVPADPALEAALAAQAFGALMGPPEKVSPKNKKEHTLALRTPEAVQKIIGLLTAYEWSFIEQAQELRSYIVSRLFEESQHNRPDIRLKALKMLGDVTEIGLFTTRTEVVTKNMSDEEINSEIHKRLERLTINSDTPLVTRINTEVDDE